MTKENKFNYKKSVEEIEAILEQIESGTLDIDELTEKVKIAAGLIKQCQERLRTTEEELENTLNDLDE